MNYKDFYNYYEKLNDKETKKHGVYAEDYTFVEYYGGQQKINFLDKFIKVFKNYPLGEIIVDESLGFIIVSDDIYINELLLDQCIKTKKHGEKAWEFYCEQFEDYMNN